MLLRLNIENFAIIKTSALTFGPGLTVFTGQTGAGKSILLDALSLCLGARADLDLIRHGSDRAVISAVFNIDNRVPVYEILNEHGIPAESNELVIRRIIVKDGNSRCFLNDYPVSLHLIKHVANHLMEIHQQFDPMLDSGSHRTVLDEYAQHTELLARVKDAHNTWQTAQKQLKEESEKTALAEREKEFLEHKAKELKTFAPKENEEQYLTEQRTLMKQKESIIKAYALLSDTLDNIKGPLLTAQKSIGKFEDPISIGLAERLDQLLSDTTDISAQAQDQLHSFTDTSLSLQDIEDRLFELRHLARKYACLPDELCRQLEETQSLLDSLSASSNQQKILAAEVARSKETFIKEAASLSNARTEKAAELDAQIAEELPPLKLGQAQFKTAITRLDESQWHAGGMDAVEFLVDMNQQGVLLPLTKVASGGEMARLMLALKVCLARSGLTPGLVFDEVDSGVGGDVAHAVGQRLKRLSQHLQVLVITHSPQVASAGTTHWVIEKSIGTEGVATAPRILSADERINEIARMMAGDQITDEAKAAAAVLLKQTS